jgi:hypothetical protein
MRESRWMSVLGSVKVGLLFLYILSKAHLLSRSLWTIQRCRATQLICLTEPPNIGCCAQRTADRSEVLRLASCSTQADFVRDADVFPREYTSLSHSSGRAQLASTSARHRCLFVSGHASFWARLRQECLQCSVLGQTSLLIATSTT